MCTHDDEIKYKGPSRRDSDINNQSFTLIMNPSIREELDQDNILNCSPYQCRTAEQLLESMGLTGDWSQGERYQGNDGKASVACQPDGVKVDKPALQP